MPADKKLVHFTGMVLARAGEIARDIDEENRRRRIEATTQARDECLREIFREVSEGAARIRRENGVRVSRIAAECRRTLYERRTELSDKLAQMLKARLEDFINDEERCRAYLCARCAEAAEHIAQSGCTVRLRAQDLRFESVLRPLFAGEVSFFKAELELGGVIIDCPERGISIDMSILSAYNEACERIPALLGRGAQ